MTEYLWCFCNPKNNNWNKFLQFACFVYNTTPHTMTRYTPYEIPFGRKANIPGHLQQTPVPMYNYDDLVYDVKRKLQECHEIARANLRQTKQHRVAQQLSKVNVPKLHNGDKVLLKNEKAGKLNPLWSGPYDVLEVDPNGSNVTIKISKKKRVKTHVNRLKKYKGEERVETGNGVGRESDSSTGSNRPTIRHPMPIDEESVGWLAGWSTREYAHYHIAGFFIERARSWKDETSVVLL
jgi:hypothetical protein